MSRALDMPRGPQKPFLEIDGLSKSYPGVQALRDVSIEAARNEVVGLVGENGAGKSTLMNIVSGVERADAGEVRLSGEQVALASYNEAARNGIFRIFQHQALVPNLRVCENLYLSHERHFGRGGVLRLGAMAKAAGAVLEETGHGFIDPMAVTSQHDFATRQIIEVVKALALSRLLSIEHPLILLDEPTSALSSEEVEFFFGLVRDLRTRASLVFVSHRLLEILELSDRIYVLKDGQNVATIDDPSETSEEQLHGLMVGRERDEEFYSESRQRAPKDDHVLRLAGFSRPPDFRDVSLDLRRGEILGVAGVIGSGKSSLGRAVFEAASLGSGEVEVLGEAVGRGGPAGMIRRGVGYVPPERLADGVVGVASIKWNIALPQQAVSKGAGVLDLRREREDATAMRDKLQIRAPSIETRAETLSGGNQQKVVIGKWLANQSSVLILDNPTNGIDVGAKSEIYALMRELSEEGVGILLISDDLLELIGLSHRILVMKDGAIAGEVPAPTDHKPEEALLVSRMV